MGIPLTRLLVKLTEFTEMGVKPPAGKDKWHSSPVMDILQNKKYKGYAEV